MYSLEERKAVQRLLTAVHSYAVQNDLTSLEYWIGVLDVALSVLATEDVVNDAQLITKIEHMRTYLTVPLILRYEAETEQADDSDLHSDSYTQWDDLSYPF